MKKLVLILGVALSVLACNKTETSSKDFKTAYIDTAELIEKYEKFKDEDDKFKVKSEELGRPLEAKVRAKDRFPDIVFPDGESGWQVEGKDAQGRWVVSPDDLDKEIATFSAFMTGVVGKFTEAFLAEVPERVSNRWLMSVLVHLMLNSVTTMHSEEPGIREFPAV